MAYEEDYPEEETEEEYTDYEQEQEPSVLESGISSLWEQEISRRLHSLDVVEEEPDVVEDDEEPEPRLPVRTRRRRKR